VLRETDKGGEKGCLKSKSLIDLARKTKTIKFNHSKNYKILNLKLGIKKLVFEKLKVLLLASA
jgi:hypothetical protein